MQRYFLNETYQELPEQTFTLEGDDFHHAIRVMRMAIEDQCFLAFTDGTVVIAEVTAISPECVFLKEISKEHQQKELPVNVTIACSYPKGDKLEWVVQKGTELGAHAFLGFPTKYSIVKWDAKKLGKKTERLNKIAKEAAEQSHRQVQPHVELFTDFSQLLQVIEKYQHVLVAYEESAKSGEVSQFVNSLQQAKSGENLLILFGPEGGFAPKEIEKLQAVGAVLCGLGPRILRAETAPLYALGAMSYQWELLS